MQKTFTALVFSALVAGMLMPVQAQNDLAKENAKLRAEIAQLKKTSAEQSDLLIQKNEAIAEIAKSCGMDAHIDL